jgi:membrane protease YdiL (CAAX protease family)
MTLPRKSKKDTSIEDKALNVFIFLGIGEILYLFLSVIAGIVVLSGAFSSSDATFFEEAVLLLTFSASAFTYLYFRGRAGFNLIVLLGSVIFTLLVGYAFIAIPGTSTMILNGFGLPDTLATEAAFMIMLLAVPIGFLVLATHLKAFFGPAKKAKRVKPVTLSSIIRQLGLSLDRLNFKIILIGIGLAIIIILLEFVVGIASYASNTQVNTNVGVLLMGAPLWFLFFTAAIEPINEEILFRGLFVPRLGIIVSAALFGAGHAGYDSTWAVDIIAAFVFGLIAGYAYKRTNSLYPGIIAHIIINTIGVLAFMYGAS